ncbi:hypothetical protein ERO13_D12G275100v2 [Gossypium hirsutum]|uniref:Dof zinc finger protein n=8 Tax=Gossypium TaxID=3633 RepID=A0A7J9C8J3_GOSGO|nr:hypothetical protein ES319_D12G304100v1 [Gossypium barbadense]KAG4118151.1 hypothetical protein ERO13_D12G275100v2 [Gossypium hirsutum]MBA0564263.1 hypothetical protein [Gossypium lobatum]MBA0622016.1 hypothetical protein [Gossypium davidsonii]MBA0657503.1 hypothetical protein [Gossypium klotzschianum]MBA0744624.1 hypothetical protein [Gossypium gossypioides]MBA0773791.1 hypothetical protein [Gossypium trilobum]MBA0835466.1 hypothetical protein [Gossypium armourianum]TYH41495.1 hypotheti
MGLTSLRVCMDSSDWLQGTMHEESEMDSSSLSGDMLTCSRPLVERRLRPQHEQALKCPRCESTHTKFCYYNNYSLSQPRYFCKTCRRYWTKGGTLRNIPVGGGCRKNKKVVSKKPNTDQSSNSNNNVVGSSNAHHHNPTHLHLSFPEMHLNNMLATHHAADGNFIGGNKYNSLLGNPMPIDFMESKLEAIVGSSRNYDFLGNGNEMGLVEGVGDMGIAPNLHGLCSPYGMSTIDGTGGGFMMLPYDTNEDQQHAIDVKPNNKLLSLEWKDQGYPDAGKDSYGYMNSLGSWPGVMNIMDPPQQIH